MAAHIAPLWEQDAALERLGADGHLEEALTHGHDPLHLAEVSGLEEKTAMRYEDSARALLDQATEQQLRRIQLDRAPRERNYERVTSTQAATSALQDRAALWSTGEVRASDAVSAACDALVAGLDSPGLRILTACTRAEADYDVHELLPDALEELRLAFYPVASEAGKEAVVRALARRMLVGDLSPREFTFRLHQSHEIMYWSRCTGMPAAPDCCPGCSRAVPAVRCPSPPVVRGRARSLALGTESPDTGRRACRTARLRAPGHPHRRKRTGLLAPGYTRRGGGT